MRSGRAGRTAGAALLATVAIYGCKGNPPPPVVTPSKTLQSVSVSGVPASLVAPNTAALTATANYSTGSPETVTASATWDSSNKAVATVAGGVVTAIAPGSTDISATYQSIRGAAPVTVTAATLRANAGPAQQVQHNTNVNFSGLASTSSPFAIASYSWNCGQSVAANCVQTGPTPTFNYRKCGISGRPACRTGSSTVADYTVTLTITDTVGNTNTATTSVVVTNSY